MEEEEMRKRTKEGGRLSKGKEEKEEEDRK